MDSSLRNWFHLTWHDETTRERPASLETSPSEVRATAGLSSWSVGGFHWCYRSRLHRPKLPALRLRPPCSTPRAAQQSPQPYGSPASINPSLRRRRSRARQESLGSPGKIQTRPRGYDRPTLPREAGDHPPLDTHSPPYRPLPESWSIASTKISAAHYLALPIFRALPAASRPIAVAETTKHRSISQHDTCDSSGRLRHFVS